MGRILMQALGRSVRVAGIALLALLPVRGEAQAAGGNCLSAPYEAAATEDQRLAAALYARLGPAFEALPGLDLRDQSAPPLLCFGSELDGAIGYLDTKGERIVLKRGAPEGLLLAVLLHELRHADQLRRGYCPLITISMRENARAVFALEADASAVSLLAAWTMREAGLPAAWEALAGWKSQNDIAARFEEEMRSSGDAVTALSGAFAQWYLSERRVRDYYVASCTDYLDRQDRLNALPAYGRLPAGYFESLCSIGEGLSYPCQEPVLPD